jgi:hypothetical protein
VQNNYSSLTVKNQYDVTRYVTVSMDADSIGRVAEMGGVLDTFPINNSLSALHLSISGRLAGTGSILSSSDVFFLVDSTNNSLVPILELLDTAKFDRYSAYKLKYSYTSIYTLNNAQTGTQILTQDFNYQKDPSENIDQGVSSPDINVYQYHVANKKYSLINTISSLPPGATLVKRVVVLNTKCTSGCN